MFRLQVGVDSSQTAITPPALANVLQQVRWRELNQRFQRYPVAQPQDNELVLVGINPSLVFVYWHINSQQSLILRLHDLVNLDISGSNPHTSFDWQVLKNTGKAYIQIAGGNRHIQAEIGCLQSYRRLLRVMRSELAYLPVSSATQGFEPEVLGGDLAVFDTPSSPPPPQQTVPAAVIIPSSPFTAYGY
jgi:hypothetical protein